MALLVPVSVGSRGESGGGLCLPVEEQRLADQRSHHVRVERLGDEERRLGPLAGQEPLREGGDEDDRHRRGGENLVDRVDAGRTVGQLELANADIAAQLKSRVLIIEDEPLIALDIERLVKSLGHEVMHIARTHREAIAAIQKSRPELVLADVQLADGSSGINAVKEILEESSPPVIFITAFPERLLTGERPEPTFLISKPYDPEAVKAMISQVLFFRPGEGDRKVA